MAAQDSEPVLNKLSDHFADILGEKYANLYRKHIEGRKLSHNMTIEEYRRNPVILSFGVAQGPEVGLIEEIRIPVLDASIKARVYHPPSTDRPGSSEPLPCYINFHGGGWVIGDVGDDDAFCRSVAASCQALVIDVGYRLSPEHRYPVPVRDSWEAYKYIASNAASLGADPKRLAVGGFSAGGHLAAVISQKARDSKFEHRPCFQLLVIPVCDAGVLTPDVQLREDCPHGSWKENFDAPFLSFARMSWFYRYFLPESFPKELLEDPDLSPLRAKSVQDLPPALVVPADVDVLRDEGIAYGKRLGKENEAWTQLWLARRVPHPFPHQVQATEVAVQFRDLALKRLTEAFEGKLASRKDFISNVD